ncbi:uncharacterized protein LOC143016252 [Genypterus blacodes]|uniref:uncharacterized protein LOC143016252 n=1 Tax=Genypterus blacodes TaxID=154954 RepID=UPI003F763C54
MLLFTWASTLMMIAASSLENITIRTGEPVLLTSGLKSSDGLHDIRWTRPPDPVALGGGVSDGFRGHCELLTDGSLQFGSAQPDDSGRYTLEVFNMEGKQVTSRAFQLSVIELLSQPVMTASCSLDGHLILSCSVNHGGKVLKGWTTATAATGVTTQPLRFLPASSHSSILLLGRVVNGSVLCLAKDELSERESAPILLHCHSRLWVVLVSVLFCCFLLLLSFTFFILRKRKSEMTKTRDPLEENLYMAMHIFHGDRGQHEEDKEQKEGVSCDSVISMETQMAQQNDAEDIYV